MRLRYPVFLFLSLLPAAPSARAQDPFAMHIRPTDPLPPEEERESFRLPAGFEIRLVASEPEIMKPMNMAFDEKGRLWITETCEYPYAAPPDRKGRDNIKILEDADGDGRADIITTFADGLNIPIGLYPWGDGVIAFSIPHIWHLEDTDGDGRADRRRKLYGPLGYERDTHGLNNAFRRGFDGWLYACHGFSNSTTMSGSDGHEISMHSGNTYRMRLDGSRIEHYTWGQVNPFGMSFDSLGNIFTADCHSKPIYQILRGGNYPSFGRPHDGLGFAPPMMSHIHGSTAIAGVVCYTGDNFPLGFRGNIFVGNVVTSRVNRDALEYHGSTIRAVEAPDFVRTTDPWFRPVDLQVGPDGALYIADFYNRIIGHYEVPLDHPGRDRFRGRIWRVVYRGEGSAAATMPPDLAAASPEALIAALGHSTLTYRLQATHLLADRPGRETLELVTRAFRESEDGTARAHALWVIARLGGESDEILTAASTDDDRVVRVHAMKVLSERRDWSPVHRVLALLGLRDGDAFVQRAAADAIGQHPRAENIRPLLDLYRRVPAEDSHLAHTVRMALRNQLREPTSFSKIGRRAPSEEDERVIAGVCLGLRSKASASYLLRHMQEHTIERETLETYLRHAARHLPRRGIDDLVRLVRRRLATDVDLQLSLLGSIVAGAEQQGLAPTPALEDWAAGLAEELLDSVDPESLTWSNAPIDGKARKENPWALENRPSAGGDSASSFLSSLPRGEPLTGNLRSKTFEIPERLSFFIAGHDGRPDGPPADTNLIRLRSANADEVLAMSRPPRDELARRAQWDLREHTGRRGYLEILDGNDGNAFAWLAVGRFEPAVVAMPIVDPHVVAGRQQAAAALAIRLGLAHLGPRLLKLLTCRMADLATREAAARALVALEPDSRLRALVPLVGHPSVPSSLREEVVEVFVRPDPSSIAELLAEAMRVSPIRVQAVLARGLAGDREGAETLLELVAKGLASARLLAMPTVAEKVRAAGPDGVDERIDDLTADLPSEGDALQKLIEERRESFSPAKADATLGAALFEKNCAICHQIGGKGALVAPQLDGVGSRGLERLLEDVLDPNRNVDMAFRSTTLVLKDGQVLAGLLRREEGETLVLVDNEGKEFSVAKRKVLERSKSRFSLMPENFSEVFSPAELGNILAFLLAQRARAQE